MCRLLSPLFIHSYFISGFLHVFFIPTFFFEKEILERICRFFFQKILRLSPQALSPKSGNLNNLCMRVLSPCCNEERKEVTSSL